MLRARPYEIFKQIVRELLVKQFPVSPINGFINRASTYHLGANRQQAKSDQEFRTEALSIGSKRQLSDIFMMRPEAYSLFCLVYSGQARKISETASNQFLTAVNNKTEDAKYIFLGSDLTVEQRDELLGFLNDLDGNAEDNLNDFISCLETMPQHSERGMSHLKRILSDKYVVTVAPPVTLIPSGGFTTALGDGPELS